MASIPTYFSHSYRPQDRLTNKVVWELFAAHNFYFTVDPPTELTSHTHLETMMLRSSCFVAVVNYRKEVPDDFCSRFVLAEFGMALQSRMPKLILEDENIPSSNFDSLPKDEHLKFPLDQIHDRRDELDGLVGGLAKRALSDADRLSRPRNRVALLVPKKNTAKAYGGTRVQNEIMRCAELQGMICEPVSVPADLNGPFAMELDKYECVALDVRRQYLPEWVFAYVYGRFIPTIKLARVQKHELPSTLELPPLVRGLRMDPREPGVESVTYWRDSADLTYQISRILKRVARRGTALRKAGEGVTYFDTIGMRPARLFVSNSGSANAFADSLCTILERHNLETWQYKQPHAIEAGTKWPDRIKQELEQCDVFVALLDRDYPKSEWCRREMRQARKRAAAGTLTFLPFQIDAEMTGGEIGKLIGELQAPPVYLGGEEVVQRVFQHIERRLRKEARDNKDWRQSQPLLLGASREAVIDALRHLPRGSYPELVNRLREFDVHVDIEPEKRTVQSRPVAEGLLGDVQRCMNADVTAHGYASTTSVLVALLKELGEPRRKDILGALLERIESTMKARGA